MFNSGGKRRRKGGSMSRD